MNFLDKNEHILYILYHDYAPCKISKIITCCYIKNTFILFYIIFDVGVWSNIRCKIDFCLFFYLVINVTINQCFNTNKMETRVTHTSTHNVKISQTPTSNTTFKTLYKFISNFKNEAKEINLQCTPPWRVFHHQLNGVCTLPRVAQLGWGCRSLRMIGILAEGPPFVALLRFNGNNITSAAFLVWLTWMSCCLYSHKYIHQCRTDLLINRQLK